MLAATSALAGFAGFGMRADAATRLVAADFAARACVTVLVILASAHDAIVWGVPGLEPGRYRRWWPAIAWMTWLVLIAAPLFGPDAVGRLFAARSHAHCAWQMALVSVLPAIVLFRRLRASAPYFPGWASAQAGLASAGVGALTVQVVCGIDGPAHYVAWHAAPWLVLTVALAAAGRLLLRQH